jgi:hypothetical protein
MNKKDCQYARYYVWDFHERVDKSDVPRLKTSHSNIFAQTTAFPQPIGAFSVSPSPISKTPSHVYFAINHLSPLPIISPIFPRPPWSRRYILYSILTLILSILALSPLINMVYLQHTYSNIIKAGLVSDIIQQQQSWNIHTVITN